MAAADPTIPEDDPRRSVLRRAREIADTIALDSSSSGQIPVDALALFLQLGLHLPRFELSELSEDGLIVREAERLRARLQSARSDIIDVAPKEFNLPPLKASHFAPVPLDTARLVLDRYHYLMSYRSDSLHFGLTFAAEEQLPHLLVSLSPFDLGNLATSNSTWFKSALVVSRVYAFPGTPRNAITFTMSKIRKWLTANRPDIDTLVTYVNPNLGFTGASYRADNWRLYGLEDGTRYRYIDGNYVTDRALATLRRRASAHPIHANRNIAYSVWPLEPLEIYIRGVVHHAPTPASRYRHFARWSPNSLSYRQTSSVACR